MDFFHLEVANSEGEYGGFKQSFKMRKGIQFIQVWY